MFLYILWRENGTGRECCRNDERFYNWLTILKSFQLAIPISLGYYKYIMDKENELKKQDETLIRFPQKEENDQEDAEAEAQGASGNTEIHARKPAEEKPPKKNRVVAEIISWLQVIVAAVAIAFVLNSFVIANSEVPTGSMEPTINEHNRVIGSRLSYTFGDPERGDIAIFKFGWICEHCKKAMGEGEAPEVCPLCGKTITRPKTLYYVKRVIGMPGDVIDIKAEGSVKASELSEIPPGLMESPSDDAELITAAVYVNGEKITEDYLKEPMLYTGDLHYEVPEGCCFMMGDNRNNSRDARYWDNPYISNEKMVAKVLFRYFPNPSLLK